LALNAGKHTGNQPTRLAHLDDDNDCAILVQGDEEPAQSLPLRRPGSFGWGIRALHQLVAATMVPSSRRLPHTISPLAVRERYKPFEALPLSERLCRLRDPAVRRAILDDRPSPALLSRFGPLVQFAAGQWDRMYVMGDPPDYEPRAETSVAAIAAREGRSPDEVAYDYLTGDAGYFLFFPVTGYARDDHEPIREMLTDPGTLLGLGDGGAHVAMIVDASAPTYMLTHWGRDRKRGPGLPLEYMVKRQTSETADFFGFHDRGRLQPGKRADINLIDFDRLRLHTPEVVNDLPAGGKRLVQGAEGYEATLVAGTPVFERGEHTGAKPGRLVRRGR
jgi:N-acyl-D-aspartate/D-glutamate deacylase